MLTPQQFLCFFCYRDMTDINIQTLGYFIFRILTNMVKLLNNKLEEEGIDFQFPQFTIMMALSKSEGLTQAELTDFVQRDKASVSRNVSYLEEKGYVSRNKEGGKMKRLFLTDKGNAIIPRLYEIAHATKDATMTGFSETKKKEIMRNLEKMFRNVSSALKE